MLFQPPFTCDCWSLNYVQFSPDGKSIATALNDFKIEIRESVTGNLSITLRCIDKIDQIGWSFDGRHIFAAMYDRNAVHVYTPNISTTQASARIESGEVGMEYVKWTPDSAWLLVFGKYGIRIDCWELRSSRLVGLPFFKNSHEGNDFSPNKRIFAYLTRRDNKDILSVHSTEDFRCILAIETGTLDANIVKFSPDSQYIAVSDCPIEHRVVIVNVETGDVFRYEAYKLGLGVTSFNWSPDSHLLGIGSGNNSVYLLYAPEWNLLTELGHSPLIRSEKAEYLEEETPGKMIPASFPVKYGDSRIAGVDKILWSKSGNFIACTCISNPRTVYIWDIKSLSLRNVFTFLTPIIGMAWNPVNDVIAVGFGTDKLLTWSPDGYKISHEQEAAVQIHMLMWRPDGDSLAAFDSAAGTCTLAFMVDEGDNTSKKSK